MEEKNQIKGKPKEESELNKKLDFSFMAITRENASKWIPFILYLSFIAVFYIGIRYYGENTEVKIKNLQENLQEYRAEYLTIKSEMMYKTKQSEVVKMVDSLGLRELTHPPAKLKIEKIAE